MNETVPCSAVGKLSNIFAGAIIGEILLQVHVVVAATGKPMDYRLEDLGPERFQQFCQALLTREFPGLRAFPVGQPDGGRDAVAPIIADDECAGFVVFQVKFVRAPSQVEARDWVKDAVDREAPKLKELIPEGAKSYFLITNVAGTAHKESGSIDIVESALKSHVPVPSACWWRDDLNRRLDSAWDLKWAYPELLSSVDLLRALVEARQTSPETEVRRTALRSFLSQQYADDARLKFKQIELDNKLGSLFVDVPIEPPQEEDVPPSKSEKGVLF